MTDDIKLILGTKWDFSANKWKQRTVDFILFRVFYQKNMTIQQTGKKTVNADRFCVTLGNFYMEFRWNEMELENQ